MSPSQIDAILNWSLRFAGILAGAIVFFILFFLLKEALPALITIEALRFLNDPAWHPMEGQFNLSPMLLASIIIPIGAVALALPFGIVSAVFYHYYAPQMIGRTYRQMITLLAGIPSVVYGLWGLVVLVPLIRSIRPPEGPACWPGR